LTHDGPFPGRPRGRRARHDNDVADWSGYDASQQDQREFPDLSPIRPSHARPAGGQNQGDWPGQQPQPGPGGWQPGGGGYQNDGAGYPGGAQGYPPVGPGGSTGPSVIGQQWPQQDPSGPFGQQVQGQPGPLGQQAPGQPGSPRPPRAKQAEDDIPDWAEPDSDEAFSARWHRRGLDSRGDRRTDRRKRRRVLIAGGGVVAVVIAVAVYFLTGGSGSSSSLGFGSLVTTFLPGELQSVPDACDTVPNSMLSQYLPGTLKQSSPPLNTGANTQCSWTLDSPPTYRLLEVQLVAYSPSALYGNGSATVVAEENFASSQENFAKPGPKSGETPATVTQLSGMPGANDTSSFLATQVFNRNGTTTDVADVLVRYRNVVITVVVDGIAHSSGTKKYGPVTMSDLSTAAKTVAKEVAGKIVG